MFVIIFEVQPKPTQWDTYFIRIIRDYSMFDRREAPQYYPEPPA